MARHAEVREKEIIEAALALEHRGKIPNPGAIRAQLGFRGGLTRIRNIWEAHQEKRNGGPVHEENQLSIDDLPTELSDAYNYLLSNQQKTLESILVQAYARCQSIFEKRFDEHSKQHEQSLQYFKECEASADESIERLESELRSMQYEVKELAGQNAKLILENAEFKGKVKAYEQSLPPVTSSN
jgi:predicted RNase H-like nuclease (RuvC/YqgF family)